MKSFALGNKLIENIEKVFDSNSYPILVLRLKETDCSECIALELNNLKKLTGEIANNIIILARFPNERPLTILSHKYAISYPILNIDDILDNLYEQVGKPYYFILNEDNSVGNVYVSDLSDSSKFLKYLRAVSSKFN